MAEDKADKDMEQENKIQKHKQGIQNNIVLSAGQREMQIKVMEEVKCR